MIDIIPTSRRSDYSLDVYADGAWVASATCYHSADEAGDEIWYRGVLEQPALDVNWNSATACADDPPEGPSIPIIEAPDEDPGEWRQPQAVTRQSIQIEHAMRRCRNCDGPHYTWRCAEIARASVPMTPVELGASLCGMLWCDPRAFVRLLTRSTPTRRAAYASAYIAFLRSERGWCDVTIADVLARWLPSDRGPAGMAVFERAA